MSEMRACPECGVSLPPDAPRGLCPRCLMGAAFSATATHKPAAPPPAPGAAPPVDFAEFRRACVETGLVDAGAFDRDTAGSPGDVARAARELVRAGKLTPYQGGALAQGKGRGLVIGSYLVLDKLGRGGMGVVFKARHRRDGRVVALKILPPSFGRDREAVMRFRREFEVAARLDHPNIVAAIDADEDRGVQFLTMGYIDGKNLDELVGAVGPLPIKLAINCTIQAATGLAAAHAQGIIHRDIKPANLMLDASGVVRVLDLGLARVVEATNPLGKGVGTSLTQSGAYMGTVDFMAPEQADDSKKADLRADIYSLGCTLHFLLTGRPPFEGDSALKRLMAHQHQPAPSLHASRDDVLAPLEAAYQTMMAKRPGDRPRSMTEVIELLEGCRSSSEEARDARAGLSRAFAETVMKRAAPRGRDRPRDASIFARPSPGGGPAADPDLRFEDVVMDLRPEGHAEPLREDQLPPMLPRLAPPRKPLKIQIPANVLWALAFLVLGALAYAYFPRREPKPKRPDAVTAAPRPAPVSRPAPARADAFLPLFDGKSLKGWFIEGGGPTTWSVEDGAIVARGQGYATRNYLLTEREYADFALRLEFRLDPGAGSGLSVRAVSGERMPLPAGNPIFDHPLLKLIESPGREETGTTHWMINSMNVKPARSARLKGAGEWNLLEVEARGRTFRASVNGEQVVGLETDPGAMFPDGTVPALNRVRGHIGLQKHTGTVRFRNIEVRELTDPAPGPSEGLARGESGFVPLFNGRDLAGWRVNRNVPYVWSIEGGDLVARPRDAREQAFLLSDRDYSDFLLRFEVQLPRGSDSGVGLWGKPGEDAGPVEVNLRNVDEQPSRMASVRTARRARVEDYVLPDRSAELRPEGAWNAVEVETRGGRLQVRVNGREVVDRDLRPLATADDATPAVRRRVGRIGFQNHTGVVRFRKVEVRDLSSDAPAGPGAPTRPDDLFRAGSVWTREESDGTPTVGTFTVTARDGGTFKAIFDLGNHVREVTGTIADGTIRWSARDERVIRGNPGHDNHGTIRGDVISMVRVGDQRQATGNYVLRLKRN